MKNCIGPSNGIPVKIQALNSAGIPWNGVPIRHDGHKGTTDKNGEAIVRMNGGEVYINEVPVKSLIAAILNSDKKLKVIELQYNMGTGGFGVNEKK